MLLLLLCRHEEAIFDVNNTDSIELSIDISNEEIMNQNNDDYQANNSCGNHSDTGGAQGDTYINRCAISIILFNAIAEIPLTYNPYFTVP